MAKRDSFLASQAPSSASRAGAPVPGPDWTLNVLVFTAGFVLMGFEIVGSRLLAPYFGNSVYVWGSLIGIILAALGVGYWVGGVVADHWPYRRLLGAIGVAAAVAIFIVQHAAPAVCASISGEGWREKDRWGPVAASVVLFLTPGLLMGLVSPFAIRLRTRAVESVGRTAGALYALSTIGSFAGTFVTTFLLVPMVPMSMILKALAGAMLVASALLFAAGARAALPGAGACVFVALGLAMPAPAAVELEADEVLRFEAETPYHHLFVIDKGGTRALRFNQFVESTIELDRPGRPGRSEYTKYFHVLPAFRFPLRRVCFVGAGGGIGPRAFLDEYRGVHVDCVDIDPVVLQICRDWFFVPRDHPDLQMIAADGRQFLRRPAGQAGEPYDAILLDAFTIGGRMPFHLTTLEFFREARERLAPEGVFLMNINSALLGPRSGIYRAVYRTLAEAFGDTPGGDPRHVFAMDVHPGWDPKQTHNVIFVGTRAPTDWPEAAKRAGDLINGRVLRAEVAEYLRNRVPEPPPVDAVLLTDEYAPIETMPF